MARGLKIYGDFLVFLGRDQEALEQLLASRKIFDGLMRRNPDAGLYELKRMRNPRSIAGLQMKYEPRLACAEYRNAFQVVQRLESAGKLSSSDKDRPAKLRKA